MEDSKRKTEIKRTVSPLSPFIEISLDNVLYNLKALRRNAPSTVGVIAVVKDCAYGIGANPVALILEQYGDVDFFAVARTEEAFSLRKAGLKSSILVLGRATEDHLRAGLENNFIFTLNDPSDLYKWKTYPFDIRFHINFDTGMARNGIGNHELDEMIDIMDKSPSLRMEGVYTHLACADEPGSSSVQKQIGKFKESIVKLCEKNRPPLHIHYSNSAACMQFPIQDCTLVRPGIALYGCKPDPLQEFKPELKPVAALKSRVTKMKKVAAGTAISYGGNYTTSTTTWIATAALGYAHGLPRFLSSRGEVLIGYKRYKIAGNVTMDYIMVDAGPNPDISVGDEVVAIGTQGEEIITVDEVAAHGNTIGYEILCHLSKSIDRIYFLGNTIVYHESGHIF